MISDIPDTQPRPARSLSPAELHSCPAGGLLGSLACPPFLTPAGMTQRLVRGQEGKEMKCVCLSQKARLPQIQFGLKQVSSLVGTWLLFHSQHSQEGHRRCRTRGAHRQSLTPSLSGLSMKVSFRVCVVHFMIHEDFVVTILLLVSQT